MGVVSINKENKIEESFLKKTEDKRKSCEFADHIFLIAFQPEVHLEFSCVSRK